MLGHVFEITLTDRTCELIDGADAYQMEGQLTTFFRHGSGREVIDCWSTRIASFRTSEILVIRRLPEQPAPAQRSEKRATASLSKN